MGGIRKRGAQCRWSIDYKDAKGRRVRETVAGSRRDAERILREKERKADLIRAGIQKQTTNDVDVWALWTDYRAHLATNGRRPETLRANDMRIPPLLRHVGAEKVSDLDLDKIDGFKADRIARGRAPATINDAIKAVRRMLKWAVRYERIASDPIEHVDYVDSRKVLARRPLEDWEVDALMAASPQWYADIWATFLLSGLRHRELVEMKWGDVDLDRGLVRVRAETCKVNREDFLPIPAELDAILRRLRPEKADGHVFVNQWGNPHRCNLLRKFKACLRAAIRQAEEAKDNGDAHARVIDPTGLHIHSLRQTFGTRLAAAGVDVKTVQTLMRHKTIAMTMQLYVKPRVQNLRAAAASITVTHRSHENRKGPQVKAS